VPAAWTIVPAAAGQFVWYPESNTNVSFQPSSPLVPNTKYTVTIGAALAEPYSFAFVTRPE
jgi:hypothetical protein